MARAELDARLLPGERCEDFAESLQQLITEPSIDIEEILSFPARASSIETPLFQAIEDVAAARPGGAAVVPRMIGGFTDAHWFRESGIVAYGFVPRALAREEAGRVHGVDERVSIETLTESIELTIEIVRRLDEIDR
jgi:acetylornithine deacetylase/succinyl-diaminopimelate desuccinylase-like protein